MMNDEGQDIKIVYSFARIDFCSKYISFALLKLLSTRTLVLLPFEKWQMSRMTFEYFGFISHEIV